MWEHVLVNGGAVVLIGGALKLWMNGLEKSLGEKLNAMEARVSLKLDLVTSNCATVSGNLGGAITETKEELHEHGHKGLEGNGNVVTR